MTNATVEYRQDLAFIDISHPFLEKFYFLFVNIDKVCVREAGSVVEGNSIGCPIPAEPASLQDTQ